MLLITTITVYIVDADVEHNALMVRKEKRNEIKFSNVKELLQEAGNMAQWSRVNTVLSEEWCQFAAPMAGSSQLPPSLAPETLTFSSILDR